MRSIFVQASGCYEVKIGEGLLQGAGQQIGELLPKAQRLLVVTDETVGAHYATGLLEQLGKVGFETALFTLPPGEGSKSGQEYLALLEKMAKAGLSRSDAVIALGGGVVGDLTGFAAATYLRGIPFVQIPTTLLAMVDSSVGGKTAINLQAGKNLAGAFYQPSLVLCDLDSLKTLSPEEFANGCAEIIKYGMLGSARLLRNLLQKPLSQQLEEVVALCVDMKRVIVEKDEFDRGERQLLNFGHTIGHAIEACSNYTIPHGKAVAMGMLAITRAAVRRGLCPFESLTTLQQLLLRFELPTETSFSPEEILEAALKDKKRTGGTMTLVIPSGLGQCTLYEILVSELEDFIREGLRT